MPEVKVGPDSYEVTIPVMVELGTAYEARKCRIVRILLDNGAVSENRVAEMLDISVQLLRETEARMTSEDVLFWMMSDGTRMLFLCDRRGWSSASGRYLGRTSGEGTRVCQWDEDREP